MTTTNDTSSGLCTFEGCDRRLLCGGYCGAHYSQARRGKELADLKTQGRQVLCGHEERTEAMERKLGRRLLPNEEVYHKNGKRLDARPSNLGLRVKIKMPAQTPEELLAWAYQIIDTYGDYEREAG